MKHSFRISITCLLLLLLQVTVNNNISAQAPISKLSKAPINTAKIVSAKKVNSTTVEITYSNRSHMLLDFYGDNIFRLLYDSIGKEFRDPAATPAANILVENPRKQVTALNISDKGTKMIITSAKITVQLDKKSLSLSILNGENKSVVEVTNLFELTKKQATLRLKEQPQEYFYGGGVQNGRFSHKGKSIAIENQNSWTDGGVASPTPYYWSTNGYGFMWYTFKKGKYDFGAHEKGVVTLSHETDYLDVFFMVNAKPVSLLNDFYQLTGNPVLIPKFGFYEGHLNAYNRDYWKQDSSGIAFEDGKRYKENQKDNGGTKESLNGEKNNYQFSARAVIDRYKAHDMPFGWILPNDGYGAGYGQTGTLDSNILNLKSFGDYARQQGVQIGLWTQSDLHPKDGISALLQRDIEKEVGVAGVRVLKTDVAWVGRGYSFGLNGVADAAHIMPKFGNEARPFIISLDGWAGTQRYATIWSGDQTGGVWEYIRFHIPTYLGTGLSGQPNITSDMDGIFGGKSTPVNVRDFQWKTFTPMQLNMDGWGANEKYPHALGEPATSINRTYLKLKSSLLPYAYSIAKEAVHGLPMIRAMFLEYPNQYTLGKATQYQYLYGPGFLVAPIYKETRADAAGNDIRNGIYLPKGEWIDYFSGNRYEGNRIINNYEVPLWKLPVFVKAGAIIPMVQPNNQVVAINKALRIYEVYPAGKNSFTEYDDDGLTESYKNGKGVTTFIESAVAGNTAMITVHPAKGNFDGFEKNKATEFHINVTQAPTGIKAIVGGKPVALKKVTSYDQFSTGTNVYFYEAAPNMNQFATKDSEFEKVVITKNPVVYVKVAATDIIRNAVALTLTGFRFAPNDHLRKSSGPLTIPVQAQVLNSNAQAYTLQPTWGKVANADYYEIEFQDQLYSTIKDNAFLFEDLVPETVYDFKLRAVNKTGMSAWKQFSGKTKVNPLEFAIKNITAEASAPAQEGAEIASLFDFDESSMWHTQWGSKAVPFTFTIDLNSTNQLEKLQYLPRNRGNGILLKGTIAYSEDKVTWSAPSPFEWARNGDTKEVQFPNHPMAKYIRITVADAVGGFGSGRELYVFKVPGSASFIPGDINNDNKIDQNDLTSYINYTGLRKGDADFEGYVSKGDVNKNNLIDAFDISQVATRLAEEESAPQNDSIAGTIEISTAKRSCNKGEVIEISVKGVNLKSVNALSFALPYSQQDFEFVGIVPRATKNMQNMTNDRLHSNGKKSFYPTFVNVGNQQTLQGTGELFVIKLMAKRKLDVDIKPTDGLMVDRQLNVIRF
ncbi:TIM-barrel domain-containing protein [Paraflavitalea sp. CAU 1676]|uniref:TIM-barrel domain-containing protein n=1 Tax=Paraflavitalea sp. CAU 1676 TaxID=3032598 RepID=UPI0023DCDD7D|nr:TIM-barrel domain-containing protein [Paraflavitalea sp. CAU 1676]MDF2189850.1 glycoside hydrolase family 31 protein [Paraflavitalea sp. CAU 1676]